MALYGAVLASYLTLEDSAKESMIVNLLHPAAKSRCCAVPPVMCVVADPTDEPGSGRRQPRACVPSFTAVEPALALHSLTGWTAAIRLGAAPDARQHAFGLGSAQRCEVRSQRAGAQLSQLVTDLPSVFCAAGGNVALGNPSRQPVTRRRGAPSYLGAGGARARARERGPTHVAARWQRRSDADRDAR